MMINALNHIQKIDHELITFSDDMDGLKNSRQCSECMKFERKILSPDLVANSRSVWINLKVLET